MSGECYCHSLLDDESCEDGDADAVIFSRSIHTSSETPSRAGIGGRMVWRQYPRNLCSIQVVLLWPSIFGYPLVMLIYVAVPPIRGLIKSRKKVDRMVHTTTTIP